MIAAWWFDGNVAAEPATSYQTPPDSSLALASALNRQSPGRTADCGILLQQGSHALPVGQPNYVVLAQDLAKHATPKLRYTTYVGHATPPGNLSVKPCRKQACPAGPNPPPEASLARRWGNSPREA